jgi:hypothetical protein
MKKLLSRLKLMTSYSKLTFRHFYTISQNQREAGRVAAGKSGEPVYPSDSGTKLEI